MRWTGPAASLAALLLAGCVSFGAKVPDSLWRLTPEAAPAAGTVGGGTLAGAVIVAEPEAETRLDVQRVPVQIDDNRVAYLQDAQWVERPARLFQHLVVETIKSRGNRLVLDQDTGSDAGLRLSGRLIDLGYDARSRSVVVRFEGRREEGGRITTRRFESVVPDIEAKAAAVGPALNRAANDVARQVAEWAG